MRESSRTRLAERAHRWRLRNFPYGPPRLKTPVQHMLISAVVRPFMARLILKALPSYRQYYTGKRMRRASALIDVKRFVGAETVVSFDLFETLVGRNVEPADWVRGQSNRFAALMLRSNLVSEIEEARAIEEARILQALQTEGCDPEIRISEWLEATCEHLGADPSRAKVWVDYEVKAECNHLYAMEGAADLLKQLRALGKRILVVAGTCYETEHVRRMLDSCGLAELVDRIYVSSEHRQGQASGHLFEAVLQAEGISATEFIHVGDDMRADFIHPSQQGYKAIWLRDKANLKSRKEFLAKSLFADLDREWVEFGAQLGALPSTESSRRGTSAEDVLYQIGYEVLGPALACFSAGALDAAHSIGARDIYYLAPKGALFWEAGKAFQDTCPRFLSLPPLRLHFARTNSQVALSSSIKEIGKKEISMARSIGSRVSVSRVLSAYGLELGPFAPMCAKYLDFEPSASLSLEVPDIFRFFRRDDVQAEVRSQAQGVQELQSRYLSQEEFFGQGDAKVLVDAGWNGSVQAAWTMAYSGLTEFPNLYGFYLGRRRAMGRERLPDNYALPSYMGRDPVLDQISPLFEIAASNQDQATIGYRECDGKVEPILSTQDEPPDLGLREQLRLGARDYCMEFARRYGHWEIDLDRLRDGARKRLIRFSLEPRPEEVAAIAKLDIQVDLGAEQPLVLLSKQLKAGSAENLEEQTRETERSFWKNGAELISGVRVQRVIA